MEKFENSWKNKGVFENQLKYNLMELDDKYPPHWKTLLKFIETVEAFNSPVKTFLDIGCGCGAVSELLRRNHPDIKYTGADYAPEAIEVAFQQWPTAEFIIKNYKDLTSDLTDQFDMVYACSLHNVLPNGDEALDFLLSLKPKYLVLGKMLVTDRESFYETYKAYDLITTYKFFHNYNQLHKKLWDNYHVIEERDGYVCNFLLGRNDVQG